MWEDELSFGYGYSCCGGGGGKNPKKNWMTLPEEMEGCVTDGGCERKEKHWERERKIKYLNNWIK